MASLDTIWARFKALLSDQLLFPHSIEHTSQAADARAAVQLAWSRVPVALVLLCVYVAAGPTTSKRSQNTSLEKQTTGSTTVVLLAASTIYDLKFKY
eukprot:scaffold154_cov286-Pinguiococcus_pyrenoidosus.AAC.6